MKFLKLWLILFSSISTFSSGKPILKLQLLYLPSKSYISLQTTISFNFALWLTWSSRPVILVISEMIPIFSVYVKFLKFVPIKYVSLKLMLFYYFIIRMFSSNIFCLPLYLCFIRGPFWYFVWLLSLSGYEVFKSVETLFLLVAKVW